MLNCNSPKDYKYLSKYEGIISNFRLCRTQLNFFSFFSIFFFNPHGLALTLSLSFSLALTGAFLGNSLSDQHFRMRIITRDAADLSRLCMWFLTLYKLLK